jgi:predicted dehydrogenase
MRQLVQFLRSGDLRVVDVPEPRAQPGTVVVRTAASVVSIGTERMVVEFASRTMLGKARARPDLVRQVVDKARQDGALAAIDAVRHRLDRAMPLGYASAGTVVGVGTGVRDLAVGDRVACAGAGYAVHAEVVMVPRNLVAPITDPATPLEEAAFATLGAVALHAIRLADSRLGEVVGVIGLGVIGQLAAQLLSAAGCRVVGLDPDARRAEIAQELGAVATTEAAAFTALVAQLSHGVGADAVLVTAATPSSEPITVAGVAARDRGCVVALGAVGTEIPRKLYYDKELQFRVSRSYGPGRYDPEYEEAGRDYPIGYVRWTENRNLTAYLTLLAGRRLRVAPIITHRVPIDMALDAYELITGKAPGPYLGVVLTYPGGAPTTGTTTVLPGDANSRTVRAARAAVGVLGAGNFAGATLLPVIARADETELIGICSAQGLSAQQAATRYRFRYSTADETAVIGDPQVNTVVIATRHHLHAAQLLAAWGAGKHVYCEKPLCLDEGELAAIVAARHGAAASVTTVGYNRRFAPMARRLKAFIDGADGVVLVHYRVNAGGLPATHWLRDPRQGGGRLVGEACHFVDFLVFLVGALPVSVHASPVGEDESVVLTVGFANRALGIVTYTTAGDRTLGKERVEVFGGGRTGVLDDFRRLELRHGGRRTVVRGRLRQDKGHRAQWHTFVSSLRQGSAPPIPFEQLVAVSLTTFRALESAQRGMPVDIDVRGFIAAASRPPYAPDGIGVGTGG